MIPSTPEGPPPLTAAALNDQAIALLERGEAEAAQAAWLQALALDPEHLEATLNHTLTAWRRGGVTDQEAVALFETMRAARPDAWEPVHALGLVHLERRDLALAGRLLEEAARRRGRAHGLQALLRTAAADGGVERVAELRVDRTPSSPLPIALAGNASLLLVGEGHEVVLRSPQDLRELARLSGHRGPVTALAVTADGRLGLSGSRDGTLRVWDLTSRRALRTLDDPGLGPVLSVALSPDGGRAVSVSLDPGYAEATRRQAESIRLWQEENPEGCVLPEDITEERVVHLWQLDSGGCRVLESGPDAAHEARFSGDGGHVLSMGGDLGPWRLRVRDLAHGEASEVEIDRAVASLAGGTREGRSFRVLPHAPLDVHFAMTPDGRRAVWAQRSLGPDSEYRHTLRCHDLVSGRCLHTVVLERGADAVQLSANGHVAITAASGASLLQVWRLPTSWEPLVPLLASPTTPAGPFRFPSSSASELRAKAEEALAARDFPGALEHLAALRERPGHERTEESRSAWAKLYRSCIRTSLRSTWIVRELEASPDAIVRLAPDGSSIARTAAGAPPGVILEDARTGRPLQALEGTVDRPGSLDFSANMRFLAAGGYATIVVWDLATGRQQVNRVRHFDSIRGLRIAGDGRHARFASRSGAKVWDGSENPSPATEPLSPWLERQEYRPDATGDGRWRFEVAGAPGPLHLVDERDGSSRILVPDGVGSAEVSRDGQWLLTVEHSGGRDRLVRLRFLDWDLAAAADADFHEAARPFLQDFVAAHTPPGGGPCEWTEADFQQLMLTLGFAGLGWLRPEGVRRELVPMAGPPVEGGDRTPSLGHASTGVATARSEARATSSPERWITYFDADGAHRHRLEVGEWVVGRASDCDVVVNDLGLSRRHARLVVQEQAVRIMDLKSHGGTKVNGIPVLEAALTSGDRIVLGQFPLQFFETSEQTPRPEADPTRAPEEWRRAPPDRRALVRRIAVLKGRPPDSLDETSSLKELGDSFASAMYVIATIQDECAVELPLEQLMRIRTIGELVELVRKAPKV